MINRLEPTVQTQCLIWFSNESQAVVSRVLEYKYIWDKQWGNYKQGRVLRKKAKLPTIISLFCHQRKILMSAAVFQWFRFK